MYNFKQTIMIGNIFIILATITSFWIIIDSFSTKEK